MFLIVIPIFLALCVLFAYLYAYVPFGVLNLSKNLSVKISFLVFYAIFTLLILYFGFGATLVLVVPVIILFILILKRKQCFTKLKLTMASAGLLIASAGLLVIAWQLEVPQKVIVNLLPVKLEIVNDDFEYIENPGIDNNLYFKEEKTKKFLNFTYYKINIYACDDFKCKEKNRYACDGFGCKGNKKYVGSYWESWSERSTLMCYMNTAGRCLGTVSKDYDAIEEILKYIKRGKNE